MFWLIFATLLDVLSAERQQIGHFPIKGNLWRAKYPDEIENQLSDRFLNFTINRTTSSSPDTGIVYYVSHNTAPYEYIESDDTICVYTLDRNLPNARHYYNPEMYANNFTVYFGCDDYCCGLECCQRDVPMTILGFTLISISVLILVFYVSIYFCGLMCAWRNGAIGKKLQSKKSLHRQNTTTSTTCMQQSTFQFGKSPEKKPLHTTTEETSLVVLRSTSGETSNGDAHNNVKIDMIT